MQIVQSGNGFLRNFPRDPLNSGPRLDCGDWSAIAILILTDKLPWKRRREGFNLNTLEEDNEEFPETNSMDFDFTIGNWTPEYFTSHGSVYSLIRFRVALELSPWPKLSENSAISTWDFPARGGPASDWVPSAGMGPGSVPSLRYFQHSALRLIRLRVTNQHFLNPSHSHTPGPGPLSTESTSRDPGDGDENIR